MYPGRLKLIRAGGGAQRQPVLGIWAGHWLILGRSSFTKSHMTERRDKKGRFIKDNVPWNKRSNCGQSGIIFTCRLCGRPKPIEEMKIIERFFPPLPACRDCWIALR